MYPMVRNSSVLRGLLFKCPGRQRRLISEDDHGVVRGFGDIPLRHLIDPGKLESGL
jgi:hypothetical protein